MVVTRLYGLAHSLEVEARGHLFGHVVLPPLRLAGQKIRSSSRTHIYGTISLLEPCVANTALYQIAEPDASPNEVSLLPGCRAAVHDEGLACDVGGGWRGEEDHDTFEVLGVAEAVEGDALEHPLFELLDQAAAHSGGEPAWGYGVDGDTVRGPRGRQITGHGDNGAFGRVVAYGLHVVGVAADQACHAGDIDDGTARTAFDHASPGRLGHEKGPSHVYPEYLIEALQGHLRGRRSPRSPAIVDDYIKTPESLLGLRHDSFHVLRVGDVALHGQRPAASSLDLAPYFLERLYLARAQHDAGPGIREGLCHVAAQTAPATGDDGRTAVETEEIQGVQDILLLTPRCCLCLGAFLVYQDAAQELAHGALGQFLAEFYDLRSLIGREALFAEGQYLFLCRRGAGPLYDESLDTLATVLVGDTDCDGLGHVGVLEEDLFDLARVDIVA